MKRSGYFVEFGATNGRDLSNTYLLKKKYGWSGLLAEPFPHWHPDLRANRSAIIDHRCVWKASGEELCFVATDTAPQLAGLESSAFDDRHSGRRREQGREITVRTVSLLGATKQCATAVRFAGRYWKTQRTVQKPWQAPQTPSTATALAVARSGKQNTPHESTGLSS